jgi:hypothetical protein
MTAREKLQYISRKLRECTFPKLYDRLWHKIPIANRGRIDWARLLFALFPKYNCYGNLFQRIARGSRLDDRIKSYKHRYFSIIPLKAEGVGSQFTRYVTAILVSRMFNLEFVHRSFVPNWQDKECDWEKFLGFGEGELRYEDVIGNKSLKVVTIPRFSAEYLKRLWMFWLDTIINYNYPKDNVLFLQDGASFIPYDETTSEAYKSIYTMLGKKYSQNRKKHPIESHFDETKLKVAVHVRRGDVTNYRTKNMPQGTWRWIDCEWYVAILQKINQNLEEQNLDIHIFSDATSRDELSEFDLLTNLTIHLRNDDSQSTLQAFHAMVSADILICGMSLFSYQAGLLSSGAKIFHPCKSGVISYPKSLDWLPADTNGIFDLNALLTQVDSLKVDTLGQNNYEIPALHPNEK